MVYFSGNLKEKGYVELNLCITLCCNVLRTVDVSSVGERNPHIPSSKRDDVYRSCYFSSSLTPCTRGVTLQSPLVVKSLPETREYFRIFHFSKQDVKKGLCPYARVTMNLRDVGRILVLRNLGSDFLTSRFFFTSFLDPGKRQWFNDVVGVYKV